MYLSVDEIKDQVTKLTGKAVVAVEFNIYLSSSELSAITPGTPRYVYYGSICNMGAGNATILKLGSVVTFDNSGVFALGAAQSTTFNNRVFDKCELNTGNIDGTITFQGYKLLMEA